MDIGIQLRSSVVNIFDFFDFLIFQLARFWGFGGSARLDKPTALWSELELLSLGCFESARVAQRVRLTILHTSLHYVLAGGQLLADVRPRA